MTSFAHNDWGQRDIINNIIILTKIGLDTIYTFITTKYQKYPSTKIFKHVNVLAEVNKFPYGRLLNMTPHDAYSITIHIRTMNLANIIHEKSSKIAIIQLC